MKLNISSIILAAGKSGRIGEPKAFLNLNGHSFIREIISKLLPVSKKLIVVFGYEADLMKTKLLNDEFIKRFAEKIELVVNENYEAGMFSSLQVGLTKITDEDFVIIHQIDQPSLPEKFYLDFFNQLETKFDWIQPEYNGKSGHPIAINQRIVHKILAEEKKSNLREFKQKHSLNIKIWKCNYPEIHQDIDTLIDYKKLIMEHRDEHI